MDAASILAQFLSGKGGIKALALNNSNSSNNNTKQTAYRLVCETLKYKEILDEIISHSPLKAHLQGVNNNLLLIQLYELLFGINHSIQGGGAVKKLILQYKNSLQTELVRIKIRRNVSEDLDLLPDELKRLNNNVIPRYVRINTVKITKEACVELFVKQGFTYSPQPVATFTSATSRHFFSDNHINNLLVFAPSTEFHENSLYLQGFIILQDKASCFPAEILNPQSNWHVLDTCAAPGNKTSHLLAKAVDNSNETCGQSKSNQRSEGKFNLWAFEVDSTRYKLLNRMLERAGSLESSTKSRANIKTLNESFLDCTAANNFGVKLGEIRAALLDPSCSGSGMTQRIDHYFKQKNFKQQNKQNSAQEDDEAENINTISKSSKNSAKNGAEGEEAEGIVALAQFQTRILNHCIKICPNLERFTYSTCSVHSIENEQVVATILQQNPQFSLQKALPSWPRRGILCPELSAEESECCLRCDPLLDNMNGFFVALFVRKSGTKEDEQKGERGEEKAASSMSAAAKKRNKRKLSQLRSSANHDSNNALPSANSDHTTPAISTANTNTNSSGSSSSTKKKKKKKKKKNSSSNHNVDPTARVAVPSTVQ
jgi:putative methyltransferase